MNNSPANTDDKTGDMNQEATVIPNLVQLIDEAAKPASPAPIKAPITVCVPLIGIPNNEENRTKLNAARHVPSINLEITYSD